MNLQVTRCGSSYLMSKLLIWRNPQGSEEGWFYGPQDRGSRAIFFGKVITAEVGFFILATTAVVETVAFSVLFAVALPVRSNHDQFYKCMFKYLQSSSFTVLWCIGDIILNPFFINLLTHESFARDWVGLSTIEDSLFVYRATAIREFPQENNEEIINQGAAFIAAEILLDASAETLDLVQGMDPAIFMFVLTKGLFIYTFGSRRNEELPDYFKTETKNAITRLREENFSIEILHELERVLVNPNEYEAGLQNAQAREAFNSLRTIASGELQGGQFITSCWQKACESLANNQE
ncbi:MAG: hypothetical protein H0V82_13310 [Candidatus Protochlamydia sp.]|nr:hypothetical protein [Candidatus Protochlamydia sp.]